MARRPDEILEIDIDAPDRDVAAAAARNHVPAEFRLGGLRVETIFTPFAGRGGLYRAVMALYEAE